MSTRDVHTAAWDDRFRQLPRWASRLAAAPPEALQALVLAQAKELSGATRTDLWAPHGDRLRLEGHPDEIFVSDESEICSHYEGHGVLVLPLTVGDRSLGCLTLVHASHQNVSAVERELYDGYAAIAAQALARAALSELKQALQTRDELLSMASHELNTPLTALQLNLQALQRKLQLPPGEKVDAAVVTHALSPAVRQLDRLSRLLTDLLDVSRIQTSRMFLDLEAFDLGEALEELVTRLGTLAAAHHTRLELAGCEHVIGYWDRLRLEQVVSNLVSNALKYGGGKPVTLWLKRTGERIELGVRDQGIGIAPGDLPRIFKRFERATEAHRSQSFGLGLFISQQIAKAHGGSIEVESTPGEGSTFRLSLPTHRVFQAESEDP